MKRANVLRLVAILAVVVLASMTTGCLKATITGKIEPKKLELTKAESITGTLTVTMTGYLAGGTFDKMDVEFFDEEGASLHKFEDLAIAEELTLIPLAQTTDSVDLSGIDGLVAPDELWDGSDEFLGSTATFTVKPSATSFKLNAVEISGVEIVESVPGFATGVPGSLHSRAPYLIATGAIAIGGSGLFTVKSAILECVDADGEGADDPRLPAGGAPRLE